MYKKNYFTNLRISLEKEIFGSNIQGSFFSTTLIGSNTRRYHSLLAARILAMDNDYYSFLSSVDEIVIAKDMKFNLAVHRFPGTYYPLGHKYIEDILWGKFHRILYKIGDIVISKDLIFNDIENQIMIRYTLQDSSQNIKLQINPLLSFRKLSDLSKANFYVHKDYEICQNGICFSMYDNYPNIYLQLSHKCDFISCPLWYYNFEYYRDSESGYFHHEDLFSLGFFEVNLKRDKSVVFSASLNKKKTNFLNRRFQTISNNRGSLHKFIDYISKNLEDSFIIDDHDNHNLLAGYPWFRSYPREFFISLAGLKYHKKLSKYLPLLYNTSLKNYKEGIFKRDFLNSKSEYDQYLDTSLWFIWSIQKNYKYSKNAQFYFRYLKEILDIFLKGSDKFQLHENGLLYISDQNLPLTWMNSLVNKRAAVVQHGYNSYINALWYNSLGYTLNLASKLGESLFIEKYKSIFKKIKNNFREIFWDDKLAAAADIVSLNGVKDMSVRSNQLMLVALEFSPFHKKEQISILNIINKNLFTKKGIRTLSPNSRLYQPVCKGNEDMRNKAYYNGSIWPWLLGLYFDALSKLQPSSLQKKIIAIKSELLNSLNLYCQGVLPQIFDGDPPHKAREGYLYTPNQSEILRILNIYDKNFLPEKKEYDR